MLTRYLTTTLLVCAALFLLGHLNPTAAQGTHPAYQAHVAPASDLPILAELFKQPFTPAKILKIDGPTTLQTGETGIFVASPNVEEATLPLRGRWDFGDGTTAGSLAARHAYAEPGTYTAVFTVSNDGSEDTDTLTVTVVARQK